MQMLEELLACRGYEALQPQHATTLQTPRHLKENKPRRLLACVPAALHPKIPTTSSHGASMRFLGCGPIVP